MSDRQTLGDQSPMPPFAERWALFLDVDGTLLDIARRPDAVTVSPELREWADLTMNALLIDLGPVFHLVEGKMVLELKPGSRDKGTAIADFMSEPPFSGRLPVFIGDDVTDEDGFAVVNIAGGHSIKVGDGSSLARWHLDDAQSVRRWLQAYTSFLETERSHE